MIKAHRDRTRRPAARDAARNRRADRVDRERVVRYWERAYVALIEEMGTAQGGAQGGAPGGAPGGAMGGVV